MTSAPLRKPHHKWTPADDAQLIALFPHHVTADVAQRMGLSQKTIEGRAKRLQLRKTAAMRSALTLRTTKERSVWSPALEEVLALLYPHHRSRDIAERLGVSAGVLASKAQHMGLSKTKAIRTLMQQNACRERLANRPESFAFQKGMVPWNKGKPMPYNANSAATQFKVGDVSIKALPVGTVRTRKMSGVECAMQKTAEPSTWRPLHELVWEEVHAQPYPAGHVMTFRDGNRHNVQPSNLHAMSRGDFVRIASPLCNGTQSPQLLQIYYMRGALIRALNRAEKRLHPKESPP